MYDLRVHAPPRLYTQVADTIRNAIVVGELAPGERLVERTLCERMGVSRTSLREAMRELENEGLVTNLPNRGLIVSVVDPKIAKDILTFARRWRRLYAGCFARMRLTIISRVVGACMTS